MKSNSHLGHYEANYESDNKDVDVDVNMKQIRNGINGIEDKSKLKYQQICMEI